MNNTQLNILPEIIAEIILHVLNEEWETIDSSSQSSQDYLIAMTYLIEVGALVRFSTPDIKDHEIYLQVSDKLHRVLFSCLLHGDRLGSLQSILSSSILEVSQVLASAYRDYIVSCLQGCAWAGSEKVSLLLGNIQTAREISSNP